MDQKYTITVSRVENGFIVRTCMLSGPNISTGDEAYVEVDETSAVERVAYLIPRCEALVEDAEVE